MKMTNLITYTFLGENAAKLKAENKLSYIKLQRAAKIACTFWNLHVTPKTNVVLQIDVFTEKDSRTIARTYKPFENDNTRYVKIEYSTSKIWFSGFIATVFIHEIGHGLGFGWEPLDALYDKTTGKFYPEYVKQVPELADMAIELDYGPSTQYAHWDEEQFGAELMTGFSALGGVFVMPVTIKIMKLLGHKVNIVPPYNLKLNDSTMNKLEKIKFTKQKEVELIDMLYKKQTEKMELIYIQPWWRRLLIWLFKK